MRPSIAVVLALTLTPIGCDGGGDGGAGGAGASAATPAELHALCEAQCARQGRCASDASPPETGPGCMDDCVAGWGALGDGVRADAVRALEACQKALPCGGSDDGCLTDAVLATGVGVDAAVHAEDVQSCLAKHEACKGTPGAFTDDLCGTLTVLVPQRRTAVARCFGEPCEQLASCLDPLVGK